MQQEMPITIDGLEQLGAAGGSVFTREGVRLGRWTYSDKFTVGHYDFIPEGSVHPVLSDFHLSFLLALIAEWYEPVETARVSKPKRPHHANNLKVNTI